MANVFTSQADSHYEGYLRSRASEYSKPLLSGKITLGNNNFLVKQAIFSTPLNLYQTLVLEC